MVVLDTSALIYWTLDPAQLTTNAKKAIELAKRILVSSISVWEIALKVKYKKLIIPMPIHEYAAQIQHLDGLEILSVDIQTWLANLDLPWEHRDPADRTIVALAKRFDCPLVTSDRVIASYYPVTIW